MSGIQLTDFEIDISLERFLQISWEGKRFFVDFLQDKINEKDVDITDWSNIAPDNVTPAKYQRTVTCMHPLPLALPWLPLAISSTNIQTLEYDKSKCQLRILEISTIKGIPFVDPIIITEWTVEKSSLNSCHASINLKFSYKKYSWLQPLVETNSKSELLKFFQLWQVNFSTKSRDLKNYDELLTSQLANLLPPENFVETEVCSENQSQNQNLNQVQSCRKNYIGDVSPPRDKLSCITLLPTDQEYIEVPEIMYMSIECSSYESETYDTSSETPTLQESMMSNSPPELNRKNHQISGEIILNKRRNNPHKNCNTKIFLMILQSNGLIKLIASLIINLYANIDFITYHGVEVAGLVRSILDEVTSLALIYVFISITEMIIEILVVTPTLLSIESNDNTDNAIDKIDYANYMNDRHLSYDKLKDIIITILNFSEMNREQLKISVQSISVGTQTDETTIIDRIDINTSKGDDKIIRECPSSLIIDNNTSANKGINEKEIIPIVENMNSSEKMSSDDDNNNNNSSSGRTWKDFNYSSFETIWAQYSIRT